LVIIIFSSGSFNWKLMHFKEENVRKTATTEIDSVGEVFRFAFYLVIYFFRKSKELNEIKKKTLPL